MSVKIKKHDDNLIIVNGKMVIRDSNGNWLAQEELTSTETKTFIEFISSEKRKIQDDYNLDALEDCKKALEEALAEIPRSYAGHQNPSWQLVNEAYKKLLNKN
jgi:hypothetical protein